MLDYKNHTIYGMSQERFFNMLSVGFNFKVTPNHGVVIFSGR